MTFLGVNLLLEFCGCNPKIIGNRKKVSTALGRAAKKAGIAIKSVTRKGPPLVGISGANTQVTVQAWPKLGYVYVSLCVYTDTTPDSALSRKKIGLRP
jgi:S-adenosylmethionine/arginine decarboxylase-like enzyme